MNRVKVTPRKRTITTISVVTAGALGAVLLAIGFFGGFTGGVAYNARPMMIGSEFGGYVVDKPLQEKFIKSLGPNASVRGAEPDLFTTALPTEVRLDLAMRKASEKAGRGPYKIIRQEIGDCVSHGWARAIECAWAIEYLDGRVTEWWQVSPESVYAGRIDTGWRWLNSDGWNGSSAAKYTKNFGVLLKKRYESGSNVLDLTTYNGNRSLTFGARGLPGWVKPEAKKHLVKEVALVTSVSEAKASLANGYPIAFCTVLGFKPTPVQRDQNGVARQNGEWGHCWSALGYFTLPNGKVAFVTYNNWGETSTTGPGGPQNIPPGAFAIHENDFARILSERDSYAVSGPYGFERRDLDHDTWAEHWSKENEFQFVVAP